MNILSVFAALLWIGVCWVFAHLISYIFKERPLRKGLIIFDLVMWSAALYVVRGIDKNMSMGGVLCDLMLIVLIVIMMVGLAFRWGGKHDQFKA